MPNRGSYRESPFLGLGRRNKYRRKLTELGIHQINQGSFQQRDRLTAFYFPDGILQ